MLAYFQLGFGKRIKMEISASKNVSSALVRRKQWTKVKVLKYNTVLVYIQANLTGMCCFYKLTKTGLTPGSSSSGVHQQSDYNLMQILSH